MAEHVHKYVRVKLGKKGFTVYRCVKGGCPHYIRQELVVGNPFECWRCGGTFIMNVKTATYKKPHCAACTRNPNSGAFIIKAGLEGI